MALSYFSSIFRKYHRIHFNSYSPKDIYVIGGDTRSIYTSLHRHKERVAFIYLNKRVCVINWTDTLVMHILSLIQSRLRVNVLIFVWNEFGNASYLTQTPSAPN